MLSLSSRWTPAIIAAPLSAMILAFVAGRFSSVDFFTELTVYRIGNAASILSGETDYIRPVQGMPIALLSKGIVWMLLQFGPLISVKAISIYMITYFGVVILVAVASMMMAWPRMSAPQRFAVVVLFISPWILGGAPFDLMIEPDYWVGEWSYLVISFCLLVAAPRLSPWIVGAWIAIGVGLKVTLIGIAPLFFFASPDYSRREITVLCASFALSFVLVDVAYIGNLSDGLSLLSFQLGFFAHPNNSVMWPSLHTVLLARPFLISLGFGCIVALVTSPAQMFEKVAATAWLCGFTYLVWRRPHDTSIASAATATTFVMVYFARTWRSIAIAVAIIFCGTVASGLERGPWMVDIIKTGHKRPTETSSIPPISGMFFQPDNYWNAGLAVQAFGYNGELGFYYPIENAADGSPRYRKGGKAFQSLFPGVVLIADSPQTLDVAERALKSGVAIWWTRKDPVQPNSLPGSLDRLNAIIERSGAKVETLSIITDGHPWLLQRAQK